MPCCCVAIARVTPSQPFVCLQCVQRDSHFCVDHESERRQIQPLQAFGPREVKGNGVLVHPLGSVTRGLDLERNRVSPICPSKSSHAAEPRRARTAAVAQNAAADLHRCQARRLQAQGCNRRRTSSESVLARLPRSEVRSRATRRPRPTRSGNGVNHVRPSIVAATGRPKTRGIAAQDRPPTCDSAGSVPFSAGTALVDEESRCAGTISNGPLSQGSPRTTP